MAKVIRIEKNPTVFEEVTIGSYFEYEGDLFIKIPEVRNSDTFFNAICFNKNGETMFFDYDDVITMVDNNSVIIEYKLKK